MADQPLPTPHDLRAIAERDCSEAPSDEEAALQARRDRGALLDLLRRLADVADWHVEGRDSDLCVFCRRESPDHYPDCPAPLLEVLRAPAPQAAPPGPSEGPCSCSPDRVFGVPVRSLNHGTGRTTCLTCGASRAPSPEGPGLQTERE